MPRSTLVATLLLFTAPLACGSGSKGVSGDIDPRWKDLSEKTTTFEGSCGEPKALLFFGKIGEPDDSFTITALGANQPLTFTVDRDRATAVDADLPGMPKSGVALFLESDGTLELRAESLSGQVCVATLKVIVLASPAPPRTHEPDPMP